MPIRAYSVAFVGWKAGETEASQGASVASAALRSSKKQNMT